MIKQYELALADMIHQHLPQGFDVSETAPQSYAELYLWYYRTGRITVWSGASEQTIYTAPHFNYMARAWHDLCHLQTGQNFTRQGEHMVYLRQLSQIFRSNYWRNDLGSILHVETEAQQDYYTRRGSFPVDQKRFAEMYLINPNRALAQEF